MNYFVCVLFPWTHEFHLLSQVAALFETVPCEG
jgi:hypothetical protein